MSDVVMVFIGAGFFFFFCTKWNESCCLESNPINKTEKGKEPDFEEHVILNLSVYASCRTYVRTKGDDDLECLQWCLEIIPKLLFPIFFLRVSAQVHGQHCIWYGECGNSTVVAEKKLNCNYTGPPVPLRDDEGQRLLLVRELSPLQLLVCSSWHLVVWK